MSAVLIYSSEGIFTVCDFEPVWMYGSLSSSKGHCDLKQKTKVLKVSFWVLVWLKTDAKRMKIWDFWVFWVKKIVLYFFFNAADVKKPPPFECRRLFGFYRTCKKTLKSVCKQVIDSLQEWTLSPINLI